MNMPRSKLRDDLNQAALDHGWWQRSDVGATSLDLCHDAAACAQSHAGARSADVDA
jgi:hypothetical protein